MSDCLFCRIRDGEIPVDMVYDDDYVQAFLDIAPVNKGHMLVIPKEHYLDLFDIPEDEAKEFFIGVQKVADAVKKAMDVDGVNLQMSNGAVAGQEIFHAHMHIIPRRDSDGLSHWPRNDISETENKEIANKIKKFL